MGNSKDGKKTRKNQPTVADVRALLKRSRQETEKKLPGSSYYDGLARLHTALIQKMQMERRLSQAAVFQLHEDTPLRGEEVLLYQQMCDHVEGGLDIVL
jgi:hypothetical protein